MRLTQKIQEGVRIPKPIPEARENIQIIMGQSHFLWESLKRMFAYLSMKCCGEGLETLKLAEASKNKCLKR